MDKITDWIAILSRSTFKNNVDDFLIPKRVSYWMYVKA